MSSRGSCVCGDVSYTFDNEPIVKALCHCLTCRKVSGSAYLSAFMVPDPDAAGSQASPSSSPETSTPPAAQSPTPSSTFKIHSQTSTPLRETRALHAEAGIEMLFYGCAKCPSTLYKKAPSGFPGVIIVFAGTLDRGSGEADDGGSSGIRGAGGLEGWGPPQAELWVKYRLPWVKQVEGAKQCLMFE